MSRIIALVAIALLPTSLFAQLTASFEQSTSRYSRADARSIGGSLQLLLPLSNSFVIGARGGLQKETNTAENVSNYRMPVLGTARYYLFGKHRCYYGLYLEGNVGKRFVHGVTEVEGEKITQKDAFTELSVGAGLQIVRKVDLNFYMGSTAENGSLIPLRGFRLGYTF